jgi:hypothetical protein
MGSGSELREWRDDGAENRGGDGGDVERLERVDRMERCQSCSKYGTTVRIA